MRNGDLVATLALVLIVAVSMIAVARRKQRRPVDKRALVEEFLKTHPGPVELRPARGTLVDPILLTAPNVDRVLELLGQRGGEVWTVKSAEGPAFVRVPGWDDRR